MCDLIDLSSPDPRKLIISKLASPLIPEPSNSVDNVAEKTTNIDFVCSGKRSSLDNNPFDKVLKETVEYVAKTEDPFEAVLEKALQSKNRCIKKHARNRACKEDFTPKCRRHSDVLKMNKTFDEFSLKELHNENLNQLVKPPQNLEHDQSLVTDLNNTNLLDDSKLALENINLKSPSIIVLPPSPKNSLLLNKPTLSGSLSGVNSSSGGGQVNEKITDQVFVCIENFQNNKTTADEEACELENLLLKPSRHRRSLSQGNKKSPESPRKDGMFRRRSQSIVDTLSVGNLPINSQVSSSSALGISDVINNGLLGSVSGTISESLDVSQISVTPKLKHGSLSSAASLYSYSSMNRAFILDSQSSSGIFGNISSTKSGRNPSSFSKTPNAKNYSIKTPAKISDLTLRFERLKLQSIATVEGLPTYSPNSKVQDFLQHNIVESNIEKSENSQKNKLEDGVKLIDADIFIPSKEEIESDGKNTESTSNCSSDSVFENSKVDKLIFHEAKILARTFDEFAQRSTSSLSGTDDLLHGCPQWNFDFLPASDDDEAVVDNLIELPTSPVKNDADITSSRNENLQEVTDNKVADSKISESIKELETEFIDQDITKNKVIAATLLLDLEKIVYKENNPEAVTLLKNLEKVLGVKYESNAQLLATCIQETNNLSKSPKKCATKLGSSKNIRYESLEKSNEDDNTAKVSESVKNNIQVCNDKNFDLNLNTEKPINKSQKSIITDFLSTSKDNIDTSSDNSNKDSNISENEEKQMLDDQIEAFKLITNLSKILGGRENDSSPVSLLTNLQQVLNLATNQLNFVNSQTTKSQVKHLPNNIQVGQAKPEVNSMTTIKVGGQKPEGRSDAIKLSRKKSIDLSSKDKSAAPTSMKRSMSLSGAQHTILPSVAITKDTDKKHSKSMKKAFSCGTVPKTGTLEKLSSLVQVDRTRASSISGIGKYKLKKKTEIENVTGKKGPLKAFLPIGNMQRRGSLSMKVPPVLTSRTPPKSSSNVCSTFTEVSSSTPNPNVVIHVSRKLPKSKPVASSTPDGGKSKSHNLRLQLSKNVPKPKFACNISPVTPLTNHNITGNSGFKSSPKKRRHNKTLSPPKRQDSRETEPHNMTLSSIPKFSPLVGFSRKNSRESIKTLENSGSPKSLGKSPTPKKSSKNESKIPCSPLKTMNNQNAKFKPFNLISKLRRGNNVNDVQDKENYV